jgi:hypothetical protein
MQQVVRGINDQIAIKPGLAHNMTRIILDILVDNHGVDGGQIGQAGGPQAVTNGTLRVAFVMFPAGQPFLGNGHGELTVDEQARGSVMGRVNAENDGSGH